mmetsp:Transcript_88885/g.230655  ORF Transcript_88885/g.230655 Transcript_88885/m.230655 type:complete len:242 (+) Transcript_88885:89-814(+)
MTQSPSKWWPSYRSEFSLLARFGPGCAFLRSAARLHGCGGGPSGNLGGLAQAEHLKPCSPQTTVVLTAASCLPTPCKCFVLELSEEPRDVAFNLREPLQPASDSERQKLNCESVLASNCWTRSSSTVGTIPGTSGAWPGSNELLETISWSPVMVACIICLGTSASLCCMIPASSTILTLIGYFGSSSACECCALCEPSDFGVCSAMSPKLRWSGVGKTSAKHCMHEALRSTSGEAVSLTGS